MDDEKDDAPTVGVFDAEGQLQGIVLTTAPPTPSEFFIQNVPGMRVEVLAADVDLLKDQVKHLTELLVKLTGMDLERLERLLREKERRGL